MDEYLLQSVVIDHKSIVYLLAVLTLHSYLVVLNILLTWSESRALENINLCLVRNPAS